MPLPSSPSIPTRDNNRQPGATVCAAAASPSVDVCSANLPPAPGPGVRSVHSTARVATRADSRAPRVPRVPSVPCAPRVRISIEGGIGVGKSTLLGALRDRFAHDDTISFLEEPVGEWIASGLLARMYDKSVSALTFQVIAATTRYGPLAALLHDPDLRVFVTERSLLSDKEVFARTTLDPATEWFDYELAAKHLRDAMPADVREVTIYLDAPDCDLAARIRERERDEERAIDADYLARIRQAHEAFYAAIDHEKVRIDASRSVTEVVTEVAAVIERARNPASALSPFWPLLQRRGTYARTVLRFADEEVHTDRV